MHGDGHLTRALSLGEMGMTNNMLERSFDLLCLLIIQM
jgi:hypothetical protein